MGTREGYVFTSLRVKFNTLNSMLSIVTLASVYVGDVRIKSSAFLRKKHDELS